ncbi:MAG: DUF305 domain-containing protein [Actinomycetota bacterium]|nr:DUF305 domain-containing protein [Actinomycetota bacterium]
MKTLLTKARTLALLLAATFILTACGGAGGGQQGSGSGSDSEQGTADKTGGSMAGMDHGQMDHGSMGMGSGSMARQMVMENGKYSDERFIDAMVPHHQGAIAMARVALKNAEHEEIIELSRNIISSQQAEIEELKGIKKEEFGTSNVPMEMNQEQMRSMGMMMDPQELANREPFDKAFIDAMIPHHQSATAMAEVAYEKSKNPRIKELAENIMSAQKREIEQMKQWRKDWYPQD